MDRNRKTEFSRKRERHRVAAILIGLLFLSASTAFGQAFVFRVDPTPVMTTSGNAPIGGFPTAFLVPNATIKLCTNSTCTITATAYTDATGNTPCSALTPVTLPGTSVCTATAGAQGQFGFWIQPGTYYYTVTTTTGTFGPYPLSSPTVGTLGGPGIVSSNASGGLAPMSSNLDCSRLTGSSASLKITACANTLPSSGGTLDTRNMPGAQTWNTDAFSGITAPTDFICGGTTFTVSLTSTIPSNVNLVAGQGCIFSVNSGITLTVNGLFGGSSSQHFSGSGSVTFQNSTTHEIYPEWWGAVSDNSTDSTSALNSALGQIGKVVRLSKGSGYRVTSNPNPPRCSAIVGEDPATTSIVAATGVTKVLDIKTVSGASCASLSGFTVTGNATSGAIGIAFGDGALTAGVVLRNVTVSGFNGTNGIAVYFRDIVESSFYDLNTSGSDINERFRHNGTVNTPTTLNLIGGGSRSAVQQGVMIDEGRGLTFADRTFESNGKEGVRIAPTGTMNAIELVFKNDWFEENYGNDTTHWQFAVNGSVVGTLARVTLNGGHFEGGVGKAKDIQFTGAAATGVIDENVYVDNSAEKITLSSSSSGTITINPFLLGYVGTFLNITSVWNPANFSGWYQSPTPVWVTWTPTFSSNLGDAVTTFASTGQPVTTLARYSVQGKTASLSILFSAYLKNTTPSVISFTLPSGVTAKDAYTLSGGAVIDAGNQSSGSIFTNGNGVISVAKITGANFGAGGTTSVSGNFTLTFELP